MRASLGTGYATPLRSVDNVNADPINNQWNTSYAACFNYLKKMAPLQAEIVERRLSIFVIYANSILSAHEAALKSRNTKNSRLWGQRFTIENVLDMLGSDDHMPAIEADCGEALRNERPGRDNRYTRAVHGYARISLRTVYTS